jgi:amino acid adenylation domain-containing protein
MTIPATSQQANLSEATSLSRLFEAQVERSANRIAVRTIAATLTFSQLNALANRIARRITSSDGDPNGLVGLYLSRRVESIAAVLGILKAGCAFVPLDTADPPSRTLAILKDAGINIVVTEANFIEKLSESGPELVNVDASDIDQESSDNLTDAPSADSLAYVLFTSGTTGRPKGVMIEHHSVAHLLNALEEVVYSNLPAHATVSLTANLSFDASVKQLFQLLNSRTIYIIPEDARRDGGKLLSAIRDHRIDVFDCTPSLLEMLLISGLRDARFENRPAFLIGGEAISQSLWNDLRRVETCSFYNVYGPTECTVDVTAVDIHTGPELPTIGQSLPGIDVRVVDTALRTVSDGIVGELVIGGPGVARGYLNAPELTAERFVLDSAGTRLYRTGDRARKVNGGWFQFIGRSDAQVKVRGYRIELGEIESALAIHPNVRSAAATVLENGRIAGYIVANAGGVIDADLRSHLEDLLPHYMIPATYTTLEELPLTENGKIDRRMLPIPDEPVSTSEVASTDDVLEQLLLTHWATALRVSTLGVDDDFFEMGGNSITATQMISNLQTFFPTEDPLLSLFFEDPTVAGLARGIREFKEEGVDPDEIARLLLIASEMTDDEMEAMLADS